MMKKIILILALALSYPAIQAQITITSSDMPSANDTIAYSNATVDTLVTNNYKKTGANHTWNFSKLKATTQAYDRYELASATPYMLYFLSKPNEYGVKITDSINLGIVTLRNIYNFYNNTSSSFSTDAYGITFSGFPYAANYKTEDVIYTFPLNFGNRDSNAFYFNMSVPGQFNFTRLGYRTNEVDGWGSIITPNGTFNCLRIKSTIHEIDSVKSSLIPFPIGFPNNQIEYKWIAKNEKIPVLQISGTFTGNNFTPNLVRYKSKIITGLNEIDPDHFQAAIYPNPLKDNTLFVEYELPRTDNILIKIIDVNGKVITKLSENNEHQGHYCHQFDISGLKIHKGHYFIDISGGNIHTIQKIIVE